MGTLKPKMEFPFYLMNVKTFLKNYGGHKQPKVHPYEVHKQRGDVIHWRFVSPKSTIIYVSHEWTGTSHADPNGFHVNVLAAVIERLSKGKTNGVHMDPRMEIAYNIRADTFRDEWIDMMSNAYIWFDWFSVPQDASSKTDREKALRSIRAYIHNSTFVLILAPGCTHQDRIDPRTKHKALLSYRTWRLNARNVLEMYCAFLKVNERKKSEKHTLLVQAAERTYHVSLTSLTHSLTRSLAHIHTYTTMQIVVAGYLRQCAHSSL